MHGVYTHSMETIYLSQVHTGSWGNLFSWNPRYINRVFNIYVKKWLFSAFKPKYLDSQEVQQKCWPKSYLATSSDDTKVYYSFKSVREVFNIFLVHNKRSRLKKFLADISAKMWGGGQGPHPLKKCKLGKKFNFLECS